MFVIVRSAGIDTGARIMPFARTGAHLDSTVNAAGSGVPTSMNLEASSREAVVVGVILYGFAWFMYPSYQRVGV